MWEQFYVKTVKEGTLNFEISLLQIYVNIIKSKKKNYVIIKLIGLVLKVLDYLSFYVKSKVKKPILN